MENQIEKLSSSEYFKNIVGDYFGALFSETSILIAIALFSIGMILVYQNDETKVPFWNRQLKAAKTSQLFVACGYLILSVGGLFWGGVKVLAFNNITLVDLVWQLFSSSKLVMAVSMLVLALVINYCSLKIKSPKVWSKVFMVIALVCLTECCLRSQMLNDHPPVSDIFKVLLSAALLICSIAIAGALNCEPKKNLNLREGPPV